jgi:hypothetical protein
MEEFLCFCSLSSLAETGMEARVEKQVACL